jgi:hypothetical protein
MYSAMIFSVVPERSRLRRSVRTEERHGVRASRATRKAGRVGGLVLVRGQGEIGKAAI